MSKIFKKHQFFAGLLSVIVSVFLVSVITYAATTIDSNINTAGTVTMESASTTNDFWLGNVIADDDDSLFFDASGSEWLMWDNAPGEFDLTDDFNVGGKVTSTGFWAGAGGTMNNIDMSNDLYVQDDVEIDGTLYGTGWATFESASTSNDFWVGNLIADDDDSIFFDASSSEFIRWDDSPGEFDVSDGMNIGGVATSTGFWAGAGGTMNNIDMSNDIYVQGDVEVDGTMYFGNSTSSIATTSSIFIQTTLKLEPTATPTSEVAGKCFVDNTDNQLNCYNGSAWKQIWE